MNLTEQNYTKGFLLADHLMAGVGPSPKNPDQFVAYVVDHLSGSYLACEVFPVLQQAIDFVNRVPEDWLYVPYGGGCGSGDCGNGDCGGGKCSLKNKQVSPL